MFGSHGPWGRASAGFFGALLLLAGGVLAARQLGVLAFDFDVVAPFLLVAFGVFFLAAAFRGRARRDAGERDAVVADGRNPASRRGPGMGLYWTVVMGLFFLLLAGSLVARDLGYNTLGWRLAGPFFLAATGSMFLLRALPARGAGPEPPPTPPQP